MTDKINHLCGDCHKETLHTKLASQVRPGSSEYQCHTEWMIVECCGCENISFRYVFQDIEGAQPFGDPDEPDWEVPTTIKIYPPAIDGHKPLKGLHYAPTLVRSIYEESIRALKQGANILAGLGLRATIEAICNDQNVKGKNLEVRIDKLAITGLIAKKDAERLHAIRFLGNDAAHDIKEAETASLMIALRIIEHILASLYILDSEARGQLDLIVHEFPDFTELLDKKIKDKPKATELPLYSILGKDSRRFPENLSNMEAKLIEEINAGVYKKIALGKLDHFQNSPQKLQHFLIL